MTPPSFDYEVNLWQQDVGLVLGLDEVGRGAFAGPVVVGAVVFPPKFNQSEALEELTQVNDSKKLTPKTRQRLSNLIHKHCLHWEVGLVPANMIDKIGITKSLDMAAKQVCKHASMYATSKIKTYTKYHLLADQKLISRADRYTNVTEIPKGDSACFSIAAASIVAKVWRDEYMSRLGQAAHLKIYQWTQNSGYGTRLHRQAIQSYGPSIYHRHTFLGKTLSLI